MDKKDITRDMLEETHSNLLGLFETDEKAVLGDMSNREVKKDIIEMGEMVEEEDLPEITDEAKKILAALGVVMPEPEPEEEAEAEAVPEAVPVPEPKEEAVPVPVPVPEPKEEAVPVPQKSTTKSKGKKGPSATKQICILICENFEITNSEIEAKLNELEITCSKSTITTQGADTRRTITCLKELEKLN